MHLTAISFIKKWRKAKNKGIDILLKAMTYINDFELWIVGSGDEKNLYDEIISEYKLEEKVSFYEWTDNISKFFFSL